MPMPQEADYNNPITATGFWTTEHTAGAVVLGSLAFLILVARGFRGISAGGVSVGVR